MKSVWYERTGQARQVLRLGDLDAPVPRSGEVLVRLSASGVNPSDVKARGGIRGGRSALSFPLVVPHSDGAGVIVEPASGSERFSPGDRVWVANGQWQRPMGTAAEYITIDERLVFPLPASTSFAVGAALGIPALTACHAATGFGDLTGRVALVSGGAGTVGRLAIQFAKHAGAFVVASVRDDADAKDVLDAGADRWVRYQSPTFREDVLHATDGRRIDHAIEVEFGANVDHLADLLADRATIVAFGSTRVPEPTIPFYKLLFTGVRLEFLLVYLLSHQERQAAADKISALLERGGLDVRIDREFPLEECATAHELIEAGTRRGAVILRIP
ncbi:NADPH:quinone reductase [Microbacterium azadirachtae]|uniref:Alcohol dehydrogenase GroES-like domain-containing protein n=1 Tax=Microbacterium azadirachtae TaxID=582680 RepID=A0A1I6G9N2_9MICO|nr:NADPH:quinone reductase [Microbacterium azadirachtae]SDL38079.1 Alcohol dehydrogenase GroES-like domain-containing protein [Microbacterium azadirachtae]SEF69101.1 Alcohol dehydrogenase GroES-like domain-containing protein [Microbacterium azadirachtae]SEF69779.1 Alcohol dehydrogenase GroES-like domain-containing protein [Microbacterium azadirachtae]SFR38777.1 Alcohol dehydrogenase GroES-like domain-containing protein [Microbacterium azadirachtae]